MIIFTQDYTAYVGGTRWQIVRATSVHRGIDGARVHATRVDCRSATGTSATHALGAHTVATECVAAST